MTEEQLQAIKELQQKAIREQKNLTHVQVDFCIALAKRVPALVEEVERLRAENTELENELNDALMQCTSLAGNILDIVSTLRGVDE